ncbi:long-chain-fatty-acid--CoA ligase [Malassezia brasiliensis]|uniref:Long-chain-fatty-acid--CoA ligase n=1 Tax=Malassezia brasiliensis TaxID=1821822 RepID=A0AAF0DS85_9BASI|nr:long-chain-fatty-acid--CoA ligase [Malassezia brasiliensis]
MVNQKASVAVSGADGSAEQVRRSFLAPNKLLERPAEGINTMVDLLELSRKRNGPKNMIATREILREFTEEKKITKKVDGQDVEDTKKWTYYVLSDYKYMTLNEMCDMIEKFSKGLTALGLNHDTRFNIFASTHVNWQVVAQACFRCGITFCTAYDTLGPSGLQVSLEEPEVTGVFTNAAQLGVLERVIEKTQRVRVVIYDGEPDPQVLERLKEKMQGRPDVQVVRFDDVLELGTRKDAPQPSSEYQVKKEDVACIMYTSGSTGAPKGVILTHANLVATVAAIDLLLKDYLRDDDSVMAYLPLAHILEFVVECFMLYRGIALGYGRVKTLTATSVRDSRSDLMAFRPTLLVGVPAVWELIRKGILSKVQAASAAKRKMFNMGLWSKRRHVPGLSQLADAVVFRAVREQTGGRLRLALSGGAPISKATHEFLRLALVNILQGYGMTESSAMCAVLTPAFFKYGCVGVPMPSIEVKLRDVPDARYFSTNDPPQGEVLIRGPSVTQGYFKRPDVTAETFTDDGWLCTGDVGQWNSDGTLSLIDRKKNLVKLQGGEYIALERLESAYKSCNIVSNLCVVASSDAKQPMAVVFPREDTLRSELAANGLSKYDDEEFETLCETKEVTRFVLNELNNVGKANQFASMEMLQTIILVHEELPLTAAQKVQRKEVEKKYGNAIGKVYP